MKNKIIESLYKEGTVREIISKIGCYEETENLRDLEQDIFLLLLTYDDNKITEMYNNGELLYFVANIVYTQIRSTTSPYYIQYKKFSQNVNDIDNVRI